jgi:hypothetical protein
VNACCERGGGAALRSSPAATIVMTCRSNALSAAIDEIRVVLAALRLRHEMPLDEDGMRAPECREFERVHVVVIDMTASAQA